MAHTGKRPISPHLQIYKPQLTSVLSVCHRFTGLFLVVGLPLLSWWLADLAFGNLYFKCALYYLKTLPGAIFIGGMIMSLYYHFFNGIRHLLWDIGVGFELAQVYVSGWIVLGLTVIAGAVTFRHIASQGVWGWL